jgi:hypothetical protein
MLIYHIMNHHTALRLYLKVNTLLSSTCSSQSTQDTLDTQFNITNTPMPVHVMHLSYINC